MPLQQTSGNVTSDAYGGGTAVTPVYIEDVMSTFLYTGNGSTQTITNGIDLSGKGGLVWYKDRTTAYEHEWVDTARGAGYNLESPNTTASTSRPTALTAFNTNGFTLGSNAAANGSGDNFVSWTFRKQPKFFDVVTYTGDGVDGKAISHSLGSVPGCIIVKNVTSGSTNWVVWHRSSAFENLKLNTTAAASGGGFHVYSASSTTFDVYNSSGGAASADFCNASGQSYVAYLFAHNAGGFGLTGTDNVISCGSYVGTDARLPITLGYEPQWVMIKDASVGGTYKDWYIFDNMRKLDVSNSGNAPLLANSSAAEGGTYASSAYNLIQPTSTGMIIDPSSQGPSAVSTAGNTFIYIAIRRGPMKVPTDATKVFTPVTYAGSGATQTISGTGGIPDFVIGDVRVEAPGALASDRLRGNTQRLGTSDTGPEVNSSGITSFNMNGMSLSASSAYNYAVNYIAWFFGRAPSFFDEVCYTGTGLVTPLASTFNHNLGVVPELMIIKSRSADGGADNWIVYHSALGATKWMVLNTTASAVGPSASAFNNTAPTSSVFSVSGSGVFFDTNASGITYVAYLFATCPKVSKVGSYTGTGATQTINCSFTGGARLVLIKRTDSTGNWYIWDTARGMVSGTDPRLGLNTTLAEINNNWVYTTASGFQIVTADANVNASGGTYIFLAIA